MYQQYRFLYHLLKHLPFHSKRLQRFTNLVRFYYKENDLIIVYEDGRNVKNPLRIPKFLEIQIHLGATHNKITIFHNQKSGSYIKLAFHDSKNINLEFGKSNMIVMDAIIRGRDGLLTVGNNNHICGCVLYLYCSGQTSFTIGNYNLFSDKIVLCAGEGHSVINPHTNQVTNIGGNITIGDNNWICMNVCFLKRARIGNGCVVGYGSVISADFSSSDNCVIAGNPAIITKSGIQWSNQAPWEYDGKLYME